MKSHPMVIREDLQQAADDMAARGESTDTILQHLRSRGAEKVECIRIISRAQHLTLGEAKPLVHFSPVWSDRRAADEAFHDSVFSALEQIAREDPEFIFSETAQGSTGQVEPERMAS